MCIADIYRAIYQTSIEIFSVSKAQKDEEFSQFFILQLIFTFACVFDVLEVMLEKTREVLQLADTLVIESSHDEQPK